MLWQLQNTQPSIQHGSDGERILLGSGDGVVHAMELSFGGMQYSNKACTEITFTLLANSTLHILGCDDGTAVFYKHGLISSSRTSMSTQQLTFCGCLYALCKCSRFLFLMFCFIYKMVYYKTLEQMHPYKPYSP